MLQLEEIEAAIVRKTRALHDKLDRALAAVNPAFAMELIMTEAKDAFNAAIAELKTAVVSEFDKLKSELQASRNDLKSAQDTLDQTKNELNAAKANVSADGEQSLKDATAQIKDITDAVKAEPGDQTGAGNGVVTKGPDAGDVKDAATDLTKAPIPGTPGATLGDNDPTGPVGQAGVIAGDPQRVPAISPVLEGTEAANTSSANAGATNGAAVGSVAS